MTPLSLYFEPRLLAQGLDKILATAHTKRHEILAQRREIVRDARMAQANHRNRVPVYKNGVAMASTAKVANLRQRLAAAMNRAKSI